MLKMRIIARMVSVAIVAYQNREIATTTENTITSAKKYEEYITGSS